MTGPAAPIVITSARVRELVSMPAAIAAVRAAFVSLARGEFDLPPRTVFGDGDFLVMSARHRPTATVMVKTLSLNFRSREPAIVGTVTRSALDSADQLVVDAGAVTALRTGAVCGVATDLLADPRASTCTVIGTGAQAGDQVRAVQAVRPLTELTVVGRDRRRTERFVDLLLSEFPDVDITASADPREAVRGREIVCCATPSTSPLFPADALSDRVHVNAIGSYRPTMRELPSDLLARSTVVVDRVDAALEEAGEIIDAIRSGAVTAESLVELGDVLTSGHRPRARTVFKSVGLAVQDWAIAELLADRVLPG